MIRPIVRFAVRRAVAIQDFETAVRTEYIAAAREEILASGSRPNISRVSATTGIHRRYVTKLWDGSSDTSSDGVGLLPRVVSVWSTAPEFLTSDGKPLILPYGPPESPFNQLVARVSRELHPGTVVFELERLGVIERAATGIKLLRNSIIARGDSVKAFEILGGDINDLMSAVEGNVSNDCLPPQHLHGRTEFDDIPRKFLPEIRDWIIEKGTMFHDQVREYLARFDRGTSCQSEGNDRSRIAVSCFSFSEELKEHKDG
jgi:hypothetical protein